MVGEFTFNNIPSGSFNLVCKSVKRTLLPAVKIKRVEFPSTSGVYDFPGNEYSLRIITMRITYIGTSFEELRTRARDIAAWLSTDVWSSLVINDETDKYYLAKVTSEIDLASIWQAGEAEITFDCQPFAYSVTEFDEEFLNITGSTNCEFENIGTRRIDFRSPQGSKSQISIIGSWTTLSLSMNGDTLTYNHSGTGTLLIDNVLMEITLNGANTFNYLGGSIDAFLSIISGDNILTVSGIGLDLKARINFIPLWM